MHRSRRVRGRSEHSCADLYPFTTVGKSSLSSRWRWLISIPCESRTFDLFPRPIGAGEGKPC